MAIGKGVGTTLTQGAVTIGKISTITPGEKTWETSDITTLDSANEYKQNLPILKDGGEITITGFLNVSDAGQISLDTSFEAGSLDAYTIAYPATIGADITFNAYCTKFKTGEANLADAVGFEATLKVDGKPNIGTSASTGISAFVLTATDGTTPLTAIDYNPAMAIGVFVNGVTYTTETSFKAKITAASHTIKLFVDNVYVESLASGSASTAIAMGSANMTKKLTVQVYEAGKTVKTYEVMVSRLS